MNPTMLKTAATASASSALGLRSSWQTTQIGQLLRYTRINALPQLFNVLRGEIRIIDTTLFD